MYAVPPVLRASRNKRFELTHETCLMFVPAPLTATLPEATGTRQTLPGTAAVRTSLLGSCLLGFTFSVFPTQAL